MTDIDLAEAARAIRASQASHPEDQERLARWWDEGLTSPEDVEVATRQALAALPHIERQIREQVAREIEDYRGPSPWDLGIGQRVASVGHWVSSEDATLAARIARGQS